MTIQTLKLEISGMTCDHCASSIQKVISSKSGVTRASVDYKSGKGEFSFDSQKISPEEIVNTINNKTNYKVIKVLPFGEDLGEASKYDLIIIGGGSAAFSAAIKASEMGKKVLMINDGLPIGGTCVNVGCVPSKTLIRTAEQFHIANHPNFTGIKPSKNKIDFKEIIKQKRELVDTLREHKYVDVLKDDPNVTIIKAYAKLVDKNTVVLRAPNGETDGKKYSAENILIATGSTTFIPDLPGLTETGYLTNDTLYDLEELPEHLIVIGGRYIALENAQMFARLGSKVTILQRSNRILPDEMPDISETLKEYLKDEGLEILTGTKIKSVNRKNGEVIIYSSVKDEDKVIEGTHIFVATGRKGNTKDFGLEELGVELHKNSFIKTNEFLQTSIPNIYAAGDVTGEYLFVYSAAYEGALAVENIFRADLDKSEMSFPRKWESKVDVLDSRFHGNDTSSIPPKVKKDYSVFPWVIFTDPQVAGVGMDENQAYENNIDYEVSTIQLSDVPRALAARNTKGFIKLIRDKQTDKLIGARILASEGSELLMEISLAIKYGITVKELKQMFHPYLTLSEGVKLAAISFDKDVHKLSCCAV